MTASTVARRAFLARTAALAGASAVGAVALPPVALAGGRDADVNNPNAYAVPRPEALADITELTIAEAAWLIRAGRLKPELLAEAYLDRIGAFDPTYQAYNLVVADEALAAARTAARGRHRVHCTASHWP
jgi:aspartyl-tRNA(Asn)/glutamyl-tRNA(Gln) amidotransferase subunit A